MGGKNTPDAPDYKGAAEAQGQSARENINAQTWANRPTLNTPWGQMAWDTTSRIDPATGQPVTAWEGNLSLNPGQQQALDYQQQLQTDRSGLAAGMYDRIAQDYQNPTDWSQFQQLGQGAEVSGIGGLSDYGQAATTPGVENLQRGLSTEGLTELDPSQRYYGDAEDAIYGQFERRAEPRFAQESAAMETKLRNQGLRPGTEAYDYAMNQLQQQQNDARTGAQYQATMGAGQEAQRMLGMDAATRGQLFGERGTQGDFANRAALGQYGMASSQFGQDMSRANFADQQRQQQFREQLTGGNQQFNQQMQQSNYQNQLRQQQIAEDMMRRGASLNEVNAILTGQQVGTPQMPGFSNAGAAQATDYTGAAQAQGQADLNAFNAQQQQLQGLMGGVAGLLPY